MKDRRLIIQSYMCIDSSLLKMLLQNLLESEIKILGKDMKHNAQNSSKTNIEDIENLLISLHSRDWRNV